MAWNDPNETVIAGDGQVYVADLGTSLPANADASLDAAFSGLGYHTEDGVNVNQEPNIVEHRSWQSKYPTRVIRDTEDFMLTFVLQQFNEVNIPLAFGGGSIVDLGGGQYRFDPPSAADAPDDRAVVCDVDDGDRRARFVVPRGLAVESTELQFTRSEMAGLPITLKALQPEDGGLAWYVYFNDADAFAAGS